MKTLMTAHWLNLLTASFETDKSFLEKYLPAGTVLNSWNGKYFMSLVAFMFERPCFFGVPSPVYRSFEEINLRFYVKHMENNKWKRGVVFIKEIAPSFLIGQAAKWLYKENFASLPMKHEFRKVNNTIHTDYFCKLNNEWNWLSMESDIVDKEPATDSLEDFIRDHYWGYTKADESKTIEFGIEHRPWRIFSASKFDMKLDTEAIYGKEFAPYFAKEPMSTFLMDGSYTRVSRPVLL